MRARFAFGRDAGIAEFFGRKARCVGYLERRGDGKGVGGDGLGLREGERL